MKAKLYTLACGHRISLVAVPPNYMMALLGTEESEKQAVKETRQEAKQYCCNDFVCRAKTKKPTHPSL